MELLCCCAPSSQRVRPSAVDGLQGLRSQVSLGVVRWREALVFYHREIYPLRLSRAPSWRLRDPFLGQRSLDSKVDDAAKQIAGFLSLPSVLCQRGIDQNEIRRNPVKSASLLIVRASSLKRRASRGRERPSWRQAPLPSLRCSSNDRRHGARAEFSEGACRARAPPNTQANMIEAIAQELITHILLSEWSWLAIEVGRVAAKPWWSMLQMVQLGPKKSQV